ncbi:hypothetical protein ED312_14330 [Sinomicrobium pectinilyticum]|uniref:Uncharacterized protein n=1 Tax=Sinomicrobium pectinilyticum TaxID=1084421 RepID=A0A3N0E8F1_SINP1|nr:hypothetical protein ED312_14330 [Sinomicrobium pectinilyticum]
MLKKGPGKFDMFTCSGKPGQTHPALLLPTLLSTGRTETILGKAVFCFFSINPTVAEQGKYRYNHVPTTNRGRLKG